MRQREHVAGVVAVAAIVVAAVLAVFMPAAPAHAGWGGWSGGISNNVGVFATWTGTNGQTFGTGTAGEFTTTSRVRADGGLRIGGILVDLTTGGLLFTASASGTIDAAGTTGTTLTLKGKTGNAANITTLDVQTGTTSVFKVLGAGAITPTPGTALAISGAPDVTRTPTTTSSACRFAAASAGQSWTPAETNAVDGMEFCCTNTGANAVTMTESAGVFEGTAAAAVVGTNDTICMEYVTDRWVQRSFTDN